MEPIKELFTRFINLEEWTIASVPAAILFAGGLVFSSYTHRSIFRIIGGSHMLAFFITRIFKNPDRAFWFRTFFYQDEPPQPFNSKNPPERGIYSQKRLLAAGTIVTAIAIYSIVQFWPYLFKLPTPTEFLFIVVVFGIILLLLSVIGDRLKPPKPLPLVQFSASFTKTLQNGNPATITVIFEMPEKWNIPANHNRILAATQQTLLGYLRPLSRLPKDIHEIKRVIELGVADIINELAIPVFIVRLTDTTAQAAQTAKPQMVRRNILLGE
jgi:hypothetical protein